MSATQGPHGQLSQCVGLEELFLALHAPEQLGADFEQILLGHPCDCCLCLPPREGGITADNSENGLQSVIIPILETTKHQELCWKTAM